MKSILAILSTALLCAVSLAQSTPSSPASPSSDQNPATAPQPQTPETAQPQQPDTMQPGTPPPTEPQTPTATETQSSPNANPADASSKTTTTKIAPGSIIPVELTKTVDAKKAKQGDEVLAKVTQDMKTTSGEVLVPKDTAVFGHVTAAQARNKEQKESELGITFDRAKTKDGDLELPMSIQAVIAPPSSNPSPNAGYDQPAPSSGSSSPSTTNSSGRSSMSGGTTPAAQPPAAVPSTGETDTPTGNGARPPINGNTKGVIGIPNLKLEDNAQTTAQGSVMSSEKGNVKLESGTFLLLRVNQ